MSERGWAPFARQHRGYLYEGPFGYPAGTRDQARPVAIFSHRMGGHKRTLDRDDWRRDNWVGVTFGIGRYQVGDIDQYASVWDAHWGNGIAGDVAKYARANPVLKALEAKGVWIPRPSYSARAHSLDAGGVNVLNCAGPAIEHEDAGLDVPWPDPLIENSIMVHRYIVEEFRREGVPFVLTEDTSIGHFQIDAVNRPSCPGTVHWRAAKKIILAAVAPEEGDDDMEPILVWNTDKKNVWLIGPFGAALVLYPPDAKELERLYGPHAAALTDTQIAAIERR